MKKKKDTSDIWLLPSNHQNLLYILGNGLIMGPRGFEYGGQSKYYKDALSLCPGWIPLYKKRIPDDVLAMSTQEAANLVLAIAEVNMRDYQGEAFVLCAGEWKALPFADVAAENDLLLVPAPLPASWIVNILFKTEAALASFNAAAENFANVDISEINLAISSSYSDEQQRTSRKASQARLAGFNTQNDSEANPFRFFVNPGEAADRINSLERAQALGGIVAILYRLANNSDLGAEVFRKTRNVLLPGACASDYALNSDDPILNWLPHWLAGKEIPDEDFRISFFYGLLEDLIQNRKSHTRKELTAAAHKYAENLLSTGGLRDKWKAIPELLEELAKPALTLTGQFEKFKGTVSHALLLFFQRENCYELFQFQSQNPRVVLDDTDIITAALLFGARDGWNGLAKEYRRDISKWTISIMALKAHDSNETIIRINEQAPKPWREFFVGDDWSAHEEDALKLAQKNKWGECLETWIKAPKSYRVEDRFLILPGDVKDNHIEKKVDQTRFLNKLRDASSKRNL